MTDADLYKAAAAAVADAPSREDWLLGKPWDWTYLRSAALGVLLAVICVACVLLAIREAVNHWRASDAAITQPAIAVGATVPAPANPIIFQTRMGSWSVPAANTPKKIATQASSTPAVAINSHEIAPLPPLKQTESEPPGPVRPLPPSPPFPPLPPN